MKTGSLHGEYKKVMLLLVVVGCWLLLFVCCRWRCCLLFVECWSLVFVVCCVVVLRKKELPHGENKTSKVTVGWCLLLALLVVVCCCCWRCGLLLGDCWSLLFVVCCCVVVL